MTLVYEVWRSASVKLPDETILHRQLVFVTDAGLEVFSRRSDSPDWTSPVDFARTPKPSNRQHVGIDIQTDAGMVVVTPTGGCSTCGSRTGRWYPEDHTTVAAWPRPKEARS